MGERRRGVSDGALGEYVRIGETACTRILSQLSVTNFLDQDTTTVHRTFVQPFILLVMIICGTNLFVTTSSEFFQLSRRGKNANVSQYGPTALVL